MIAALHKSPLRQKVLKQSRKQIDTLIDHLFGMLTEEEIETLRNIFNKCVYENY